MTRRTRSLAAASALAAAAVTLSACSAFSPHSTLRDYNPGDGVPVTVGAVSGMNLVVVAEKKDGPGVLTGAVVNRGPGDATVGFVARDAAESGAKPETTLTVKARETKPLPGITLAKVPAPGEWTQVYIVTDQGREMVSVPVLTPTGTYSTYKPTSK